MDFRDNNETESNVTSISLLEALKKGDSKAVQTLLANGADENRT